MRLSYQNQTIEGHISIMQRFAKFAPNARRPSISDQLRNKLGDQMFLQEAVDFHPEVQSTIK